MQRGAKRALWCMAMVEESVESAQSGVLGGVQDARIARATGAAGCARP